MKSIIIAFTLLFAAGCALLPETPVYAVHDFGPPPLTTDTGDRMPPAQISVEAPEWLADTRIRYRLLYAAPTQVRFYSLDHWLAAPNELLEQQLSAVPALAPHAVEIDLESFEQQFKAPGKAEAVLQFRAVSAAGNGRTRPAEREFLLKEPCQTADARGAVSAFSVLAKRAAGELSGWLLRLN